MTSDQVVFTIIIIIIAILYLAFIANQFFETEETGLQGKKKDKGYFIYEDGDFNIAFELEHVFSVISSDANNKDIPQALNVTIKFNNGQDDIVILVSSPKEAKDLIEDITS